MPYSEDAGARREAAARKGEAVILAIETSCDETSAAIVRNGRRVLSLFTNSQIEIHQKYGGVVPEIASRRHVESIGAVVQEALLKADMKMQDMDAVAVTSGPGLIGALLVGVSYAKAVAYYSGLPLLSVNHIDGHISANYISDENSRPPFLCLVISGGHTLLVDVRDFGDYKIIGQTLDDAAGEAFDKGARLLGLPYPGGYLLDQLSKDGDIEFYRFPRAKTGGLDFSYSGLKTALKQYIEERSGDFVEANLKDIAASYQRAIVEPLVNNTMEAVKKLGYTAVAMAGGVAANSALRALMEEACTKNGFKLACPPPWLCTDNAAMIGAAAFPTLMRGDLSPLSLNAFAARFSREAP